MESTSVGKRQLLLPDEVLRYPLDQGMLIIRGHNVLRFRKMDYTEHADAKKLHMEKVEEHIPGWYKKWEEEQQMNEAMQQAGKEMSEEEMATPEETVLAVDTKMPKKEKARNRKNEKVILKVEDLFSQQERSE